MQESVLSARLGKPLLISEEEGVAEADDRSKTKKTIPSLSRLLSSHAFIYRTGTSTAQLISIVSICFLLILASVFFYFRSRSDLVCVSPSDPYLRLNLSGVDGLNSDFGSLGVPWCRSKHGQTVEWTTKDLIKGLEEFVPIYENRPIKNNVFGMGFDHSFGLWFIVHWLKPDLMIESGALKGHSTWVLRQAMPETRIITLSPHHPMKYLKKGPAYVDENCTYFAGKDFVDFGSIDWQSVLNKHGISDFNRVLVFFDDHQNALKRLKQALKAGIRHLVFEDNYDTGSGDQYSLRQICDQFYIRGTPLFFYDFASAL